MTSAAPGDWKGEHLIRVSRRMYLPKLAPDELAERRRKFAETEAVRAKVCELYANGMTAMEIAPMVNRSYGQVTLIIRESGLRPTQTYSRACR